MSAETVYLERIARALEDIAAELRKKGAAKTEAAERRYQGQPAGVEP